ncbi:MAG: ribosome small subunit-dependent GTPase A [Anaerolineae bacterium]|nr:ribosome small subunit-dependent GTPase A [Anaerolineae bacterium]
MDTAESTNENTGVVFKKTTGTYYVNAGGQTITCTASAMLRKELILPTASRTSVPKQRVVEVKEVSVVDPVAVGDLVRFIDLGGGAGHIKAVLPRRSKLTRRAAGRKPLEQVIVANVDQVIPVFAAAQPKPTWHLLDRYLASAEVSEVPSVILITKLDLVRGRKAERELAAVVEEYRALGYPALLTSAVIGAGMEALKDTLKDKVSVFVGKSGVGKTTLLNAIQPDLGLRVNEVNEKIGTGRHTTTHLEMFPLDIGGAIVDTPGMKTFGLWNIETEDLAWFFIEMRPFVGACKFGLDCTHHHEPGCAIKRAVEDGQISERRYASYLQMREHMYLEY